MQAPEWRSARPAEDGRVGTANQCLAAGSAIHAVSGIEQRFSRLVGDALNGHLPA